MMRLFVAIALPPEIGDTFMPLMRGVPGARWRPQENLHITLRFIGDLDERRAEDLDTELARIVAKPLTLQTQGAGCFGGSDPDNLHLKLVENPGLMELARRCEKACRSVGLAPNTQHFQPHVTLAYLSGRAELDRVMAFVRRVSLYRSEPFLVTSFGLYSSWQRDNAPGLYRLEAEYPLF